MMPRMPLRLRRDLTTRQIRRGLDELSMEVVAPQPLASKVRFQGRPPGRTFDGSGCTATVGVESSFPGSGTVGVSLVVGMMGAMAATRRSTGSGARRPANQECRAPIVVTDLDAVELDGL